MSIKNLYDDWLAFHKDQDSPMDHMHESFFNDLMPALVEMIEIKTATTH